MYMSLLKTAFVEALQRTFDASYPVTDFRNVLVSVEFPIKQSAYPSLWVNYEDTQELSVAGIGHTEYITASSGETYSQTRWRFGGTLTITIVAMSSRERDRLYDEVVKVFAFAKHTDPPVSVFRSTVDNNDLIALNVNFDDLQPSGANAAPGTPWGTDEMIYEISVSMDLIGEFVNERESEALVKITEWRVHPFVDGVEPVPNPPVDSGLSATDWQ